MIYQPSSDSLKTSAGKSNIPISRFFPNVRPSEHPGGAAAAGRNDFLKILASFTLN
jgi:hypothetical protein